MKLREAQLLGILALIAVGIILLCMWGGGGEPKEPQAADDQAQALAWPNAPSGAASLVDELRREELPPAGVRPAPTQRVSVQIGGATPPSPATEEAAIRTRIEEKLPQQIPLEPPKPAAATEPAKPAVETVAGPRTHIVQKGDILGEISKKYYGTTTRWPEIVRANPGVDPNRLSVGQKLTIPAATSVGQAGVVAAASAPPALSATGGSALPKRSYTVQKGDSLFEIAKRFYGDGSRLKDIQAANRERIPDANRLREGMEIVIP